MASLDSVRLKIDRAHEHLDALEGEITRYYATKPAEFVADPTVYEDDAGQQFVFGSFKSDAPPPHIAVVMGDVLQNLRSALDYLIWELVLANKQQPGKKNQFPICETDKGFSNELGRGRLDGVHADAVTEVKRLQPYFGGADVNPSFLWTLEKFTNINKHRRVLLTVLRTFPVPEGLITRIDRSGVVRSQITPILGNTNTQVGPVPVVGGKVQMNPPMIGFIGLAEEPPYGMEVWSFLHGTEIFVRESVLPQFEGFF
jgi:hypothetical protein